MNVVNFAYQILEMQARIQELESENAKLRNYRERYNDLLNSSVEHNQHMMLNLLNVAMTPGVVEAMQDRRN